MNMFNENNVQEYVNNITTICHEYFIKYHTHIKNTKLIEYHSHRRFSRTAIMNALHEFDGNVQNAINALNSVPQANTLFLFEDNEWIPIDLVAEHINVENESSTVLGSSFMLETNRDLAYAEYICQNAKSLVEAFFKKCPMFIGDLKLHPEQLLCILWNTIVLPIEIKASVQHQRGKHEISIPANHVMKMHINTNMPGSGKTIMLIETWQ